MVKIYIKAVAKRFMPIRVMLEKNVAIWGGTLDGFRALKEAFGAPISDGGCLEEDEND